MFNDLSEHVNLPMISLKKTIEKLFANDQFERAQHMRSKIS